MLPSAWQTTGPRPRISSLPTRSIPGRTIEETDPDGNVTYTVYNNVAQETRTYPGWHDVGNGVYETTGPIQVSRTDLAGNYSESLTYTWIGTGYNGLPTNMNGSPTGQEDYASSLAVIQSLSRSLMNDAGQVTQSLDYFAMPAPGIGSPNGYSTSRNLGVEGANYLETDSYYNDLGRVFATVDPTDTWQFSFYNYLGRVTSQWKGTNLGSYTPAGFSAWGLAQTTPPTVGPSGTAMYETSSSSYDADGKLVESQSYWDVSGTGSPRTTYYQYDWQDRQVGTLVIDYDESGNPYSGVATVDTLDNLGETKETKTFANTTVSDFDAGDYPTADLRAQSESDYDSQDRVYETRTYNVAPATSTNPSPGTVGDYLPTDTWYDARSNVVATRTGSGAIQKSVYNSDGELVETYICADNVLTLNLSYAQATGVNGGDTVVEQTQNWYDADGNAVATAEYQRLPGDTTTTGALSATDSYVTATATFYDTAGRDIEDVNYGRQDVIAGTATAFFNANGTLIAAADGNPAAAEGTPPAPNTSDNYIVSKTVYDLVGGTASAGWASGAVSGVETIDNAGIATLTETDMLGRTVRTVQDYQSGGFSTGGVPLAADTASDLTTDYQFDTAGRLTAMTVYDATGTSVVPETTQYQYTSPIDGSLETAEIDPDSHETSTTYNLDGTAATMTDPRG